MVILEPVYTIEYDGEKYTVIKMGDVDSDARTTSADYVKFKNYIMEKSSLSDVQKQGADVDLDGKTTSADYVRLKNYIMGKDNITI